MALDNEGSLIFIFVISLHFISVSWLFKSRYMLNCLCFPWDSTSAKSSDRLQRVSIADSGFERISNKWEEVPMDTEPKEKDT